MPLFSGQVTVFSPSTDQPLNNYQTRTLYVAKREVELLPLRRVRCKNGKLKSSVILLEDLQPVPLSILLRIKHVAIDFTQDLKGEAEVVPGLRFIGRIPLQQTVQKGDEIFTANDRLLVFPYSACWMQSQELVCDNCIRALTSDINAYETHVSLPCLRDFVYGKLINGGLQDYICVPSPAYSVVKIPEVISLHDCLFLFDLSLPLLSFCVDTLAPLLAENPQSQTLIFLENVKKEANDCLLVLKHLKLDHANFTLTDSVLLSKKPWLESKYTGRFQHVLLFDSTHQALHQAIKFGVQCLLTLALFRTASKMVPFLDDRVIYHSTMSYKDKFLLEALLGTLALLNKKSLRSSLYLSVAATDETEVNSLVSGNDSLLGHSEKTCSSSSISDPYHAHNKTLLQSVPHLEETRIRCLPKTISWLYCDGDFRLCLDDSCAHDIQSRCHLTKNINDMALENCQMKRVFYTHKLACHVYLNAFIF